MEGNAAPDVIRLPAAVACRALALFSVVGLALGADRDEVKEWLPDNDLWKELAPSEAGFVDTPAPSRKQVINAGWLSERLIVLALALRAIDHLPAANEQCHTAIFQGIFLPYTKVTVSEFVAGARLRDDADRDGRRNPDASLRGAGCETQQPPAAQTGRYGNHPGAPSRHQLDHRLRGSGMG